MRIVFRSLVFSFTVSTSVGYSLFSAPRTTGLHSTFRTFETFVCVVFWLGFYDTNFAGLFCLVQCLQYREYDEKIFVRIDNTVADVGDDDLFPFFFKFCFLCCFKIQFSFGPNWCSARQNVIIKKMIFFSNN